MTTITYENGILVIQIDYSPFIAIYDEKYNLIYKDVVGHDFDSIDWIKCDDKILVTYCDEIAEKDIVSHVIRGPDSPNIATPEEAENVKSQLLEVFNAIDSLR